VQSCSSCTTSGTTCGQGQRQTGCGGGSAGGCSACDALSYQDSGSHRQQSCKACTSCGPGTMLVDCGGASGPGSCPGCPGSTYNDQVRRTGLAVWWCWVRPDSSCGCGGGE
jgi:hypothetical protein